MYPYQHITPINFWDPMGLYTLEYGTDGEVYAVIDLEAGDTLYKIAEAEVGDGNAWKKMGYEGDPGYLKNGERVKITGIYNDRYPNPNKPYLSQEDYDAGVRLTMVNGKWYYDVSIPINNLFVYAGALARSHAKDYLLNKYKWFISMVNHGEDWDIKRANIWNKTVGTAYPGSATSPIVLFGNITTPEEIGNMLYGYAGTAAGMSETELIGGSMWAAGVIEMITSSEARTNEYSDHSAIRAGINWYKNGR